VTLAELMAFAGRHPYLSLGLAALTVAIAYNEIAGRLTGYKRIPPARLTALVNRDNALVVDLRPIAEFEKGHIAGAKNVQPSQFDPEHKQLAAARALPVVLVCKAGQSAGAAAKRLKQAGFEQVYVLEGGIQAWQQADLPLARGRA
jgi:rhodanese-related sulfurtransferase